MTATNSDITAAEFDARFDSFTSTVVRLETLPAFNVGGAEQDRIDAWRAGKPRPLRSVRTDPWLARIARTTILEGRDWSRVRLVDDPLTDYQRYQLAGYIESQTAGDTIEIARRDDVGDLGIDVWLYDHGLPTAAAVLLHYRPDGRPGNRELVTDPAALDDIADRIARARAAAVPLNEFLADHASG